MNPEAKEGIETGIPTSEIIINRPMNVKYPQPVEEFLWINSRICIMCGRTRMNIIVKVRMKAKSKRRTLKTVRLLLFDFNSVLVKGTS